MLDEALIQLMEDVGGDSRMDVGVRPTSEERLRDVLEAVLFEHLVHAFLARTAHLVCAANAADSVVLGTWFSLRIVAQMEPCDVALRTSLPVAGTCHQALLGVVRNVACEDGVAAANSTVGARKVDAVLRGLLH